MNEALTIRPAQNDEFPLVLAFYHELIDAMEGAEYSPAWKKGIYPTSEFLADSIRKGELYIGLFGGKIVSSMVLNQEANDGYRQVAWAINAPEEEILILHTLGVARPYGGRGIAKEMLRAAISLAKARHLKAIHLDVLRGNLPAMHLYPKVGFVCRGSAKLFYEDTGWMEFFMFEYLL